ncbi:MAG TPA: hypothetical protein VJN22_04060, partial [Candidatus Eremiobacteraceae bacterium]|nr:hypothetical protein [Candidatus Eremiobacteraceae bacterium]
MRRWSFIFAALFIAGCSSHSVVQSQSFTPDIFQRKLYHGWQPIRLAAINGNTPQVTGIASDAVNHKMWAITNAQPATGGSLTRITMGGQLDTYPMALTPWAITVGPDDNVWVADEDTNSNLFVSRFTQSGVETDYPIPQFMEASVVVEQIINGPDGAMWFTACYPQGNVGGVGRIDTSGSVSFFPSFCDMAIASGPDGNLWYGDRTNVYAMNTQGTILGTYPIGQVQPKGIAAGADGNLYVLSVDSQQMSWCSRVTPGGIITPVGSA